MGAAGEGVFRDTTAALPPVQHRRTLAAWPSTGQLLNMVVAAENLSVSAFVACCASERFHRSAFTATLRTRKHAHGCRARRALTGPFYI